MTATNQTDPIRFPFPTEGQPREPQEGQEPQEVQQSPETQSIPPALTLSCEEAAALMRVSRSMFYKLKNWGLIGPAHFKVGPRLVKYRKDEFEAWILAGMPRRKDWRWQHGKEGAH